jgi:nucleotide-binding universal stress UspA family protein
MHFLIYVDAGLPTEPAVRLGAQLAAAAGAEITLLAGTAEPAESLAAAQALLPAPAEVRRRPERRAEALLAESTSGEYDLVIAGSRGLRGWQRLARGGSVAARLARRSPRPVLLVKGLPRPAGPGGRVLACTSGDARGERAVRWGARLAHWLGAELTVLHVMSQLALSAEAPLDQLDETADEAMTQATPEGRHLARALEVARGETGGALAARPLLRHGLVLDEVVTEAREGDYDVVVIGGHAAPDTWPLGSTLLEDVADQILTALERPVLVVQGSD